MSKPDIVIEHSVVSYGNNYIPVCFNKVGVRANIASVVGFSYEFNKYKYPLLRSKHKA